MRASLVADHLILWQVELGYMVSAALFEQTDDIKNLKSTNLGPSAHLAGFNLQSTDDTQPLLEIFNIFFFKIA